MRAIQRLSQATPDSIRDEFLAAVTYLLASVRRRSEVVDQIQELRGLLDSLPLTTDAYGVAANRLGNAHRYLLSNERGAARFELQLLAGGLQCERELELVPRRLRRAERSSPDKLGPEPRVRPGSEAGEKRIRPRLGAE